MTILVTGGAGFIGSHLSRALLGLGHKVVCADNLTLGSRAQLAELLERKDFLLCETDVSDMEALLPLFQKHSFDMVYHLAANSDIQKGGNEPGIDFRDTFLTTRSVLECMRRCGVARLFFASTSAVYGEKTGVALREDTGGLWPVSYYGGAKFASEAFISSYTAMCGWSTVIFRFPNVIGPGLTHGVLFDFKRKLEENPARLPILGDGRQCKPYLHVADLVDVILRQTRQAVPGVQVFNVGVESATTVTRIADILCEEMGLENVRYEYTGGDRGWKGDVPTFRFDLERIHQTGWRPERESDDAVRAAARAILGKAEPQGGTGA